MVLFKASCRKGTDSIVQARLEACAAVWIELGSMP
jgi:hypothetical protein